MSLKKTYNPAALAYGGYLMELSVNQAAYKDALKRCQDAVFDDANSFIDAMIAIDAGEVVYSRPDCNGQNGGIRITTQHMIDYIADNQYKSASSGRAESAQAKRSREAAHRLLANPASQSLRNELLGYNMVYEVMTPFIIQDGNLAGPATEQEVSTGITAKNPRSKHLAAFENFMRVTKAYACGVASGLDQANPSANPKPAIV